MPSANLDVISLQEVPSGDAFRELKNHHVEVR